MHRRLVLGSLTACLLAACPTPTEPEPKSEPKPEPKSNPKPEPKLVSLEGAPAVPGVKVVTPIGECPALATLPEGAPESQRKLVPTLEVLRGIACEPGLFGQSTPAIRAAVKAPEGLDLTLSRRSAGIRLTERVAVGDILAVLGINPTNLRFVGPAPFYRFVDPDGKPPSPWPPSELWIGFTSGHELRAQGIGNFGTPPEQPDPTEFEYKPESMIDSLRIAMPESALEFEHDEFAAAALLEALKVLAAADDPNKLGMDALPSLGERYWIWDWGFGIKPGERTDTTISPHRTELLASELAEAMVLPSPSHANIRTGDTDFNKLASGGESPFVWQGLSVEVGLSKRPGVDEGLDGWIVDSVTVERAVPSK